jgi:hypothetical protein
MSSELDTLRARSDALADRLADPEALEVNAAILDLDPGDPKSTNRLGIGLFNAGRPAEAVPIFEQGLRLHPDNEIMRNRHEQARWAVRSTTTTRAKRKATKSHGAAATAGWTDFEPRELVETSVAGAGRDACIRFCAASVRASESIDAGWTAVTPIKVGRRFRTIGGIFTGVAPWKDSLTVGVPVARRSLIEHVHARGGYSFEPAKAVPCVQIAVPRPEVEAMFADLLEAHVEHLRLSLAAGPPTHLDKHHPGLRRYLLEQADLLDG